MSTFTTSFGRTIPVVPGYLEAHETFTQRDVNPPPEGFQGFSPFGIDGFIKDAYEYGLMIDFMEELGVARRWGRTLDIGGSEGTMARMLRGEGRAECAATLDLVDFSVRLSTADYLRHWARFRAACALAQVNPALRRFLLGEAPWRGKRLTALYPNFGYRPLPGATFWNLRLRALPRLDRSIIQDLYTLEEPFDLITSFLAMPCFDAERKIAKVSSLLPEGGMFFFLSDNWWFAVSSALLVGKFPYAGQRLTREDFERYVREHHAAQYDDWMRRYNYYHEGKQRPTLDEYIRIADAHDLELVGARRLFPPHATHFRAKFTPRELNRFDDTRLAQVLEDVRQFRPDVGLADLMSNYHMAVFVKRPRRHQTLAANLQRGVAGNGAA